MARRLATGRSRVAGTFRIEPAQMGLRRYWLGRGETAGGRFEVADGNLDVSFTQARMADVDFSGLRFSHFWTHDSVFERCDFSGSAFDHLDLGATFHGGERWDGRTWPVTLYRECVFARTRLPPNTFWGNARFERCVFDRARFRGFWSTQQAQFVDCTFRGKVQDVTFWGRPTDHTSALGRDRNAFRGNDFTGAELIDVEFRHIDLDTQRFPGLPGYAVLDRIDQRVAATLAATTDWPQETKTELARYVRIRVERAVAENDGHALVSRDWVGRRLPPEVRDQIFWLLVNYSDDQQ